jgi:hypothetical protein
MTVSRQQISWILWPLWVVASAAGNALGAAVLSVNGFPVVFLTAAVFPAFLQWLIFRCLFSRAGWWILASSAGSLLGFLTIPYWVAIEDTQGPTAFARIAVPAIIALGGAVTGTAEWFVLRRWTSRSRWLAFACWVVARSIAWFGATFVFASLSRVGGNFGPYQWAYFLLGGGASGALSGAVTGLVLVWLLRSDEKDATSASLENSRRGHFA